MENKLILPLIITALLFGGAGFFGGMKYAQSKSSATPGGQFAAMRANGGMGAARLGGGAGGQLRGVNGGGMTSGEVVMKDDAGLTVKLRDGSSKNIYFASSTSIGKMAEGSKDDLSQGTEVVITGTNNQDGSITANMIQIRPEGSAPMGFGGQPPESAPQQ
ncbi:MAG: hypothetical protein RDU25_02745 [Patescibacteria group bacterium]|nr:hypothetical protein [Patescibacteria group bacterium]